ncbi:DEAD/DEAH box helicase [uncultured Parasutterella sp.]|jgi:ATP-dependent RNA helicase RhlE|uniref:DEAD/DEAH box helicase n=1 Tax=uncultured Parasutterella sp. TaxID=1263098 RepID=UPI0025EBEA54|nr:DEAD/DEAH box helicase [uncultured Parasutterella sp.]
MSNSFKTFGLAPQLEKSIEANGFTSPTPIQMKAIPLVRKGYDLLAAAQTGTGKTAAFVLPMLQKMIEEPTLYQKRVPRVLVLTPTRELAVQVGETILSLGKDLGVRSAVVFGGVGINPQKAAIAKGLDFLVATPGRLLDLMNQGFADLSKTHILILDEADRMLDMGFLPDLKRILKVLPPDRQTLLFSATFSPEIKKLASEFLNKPESVEIERNKDSSLVRQTLYRVPKVDKHTVLRDLIVDNQWDQVLVFTRTKYGADKLVRHLLKDGLVAKAIHGDKSQNARTTALKEFKEHKLPILVATDIAARGLDIEKLPQVVNYELPQQAEDYVHRIGRTGRAGEAGEAHSLVSPEELPQLAAIEKFIKKPLPLSDFPGLDYSDWKVSAPTKPQNKNRRPGPRRNGPAGFKRSDGKPSVRRKAARGQ